MNRSLLKKISALLLSVLLILSFASCGEAKDTRQRYSCDIWDSFDTIITVMAYCEDDAEFKNIENTARSLFREYNDLFDIYNDYDGIANIKTINDNAGISPVKVDKNIIDLIKFGKKLYLDTEGNVNIAFGSVLKIWHEAREISENDESKAYIPDIDELKAASMHCSIDDIIIDEDASTIYLKDPQMSLDVGAIAKGFATELVCEKLMQDGNDCFLITAGSSSIKAVGNKPDGSSWTTAVETDPDYGLINISGHSITTSGIYQRYYMYDGRQYHHIINKDTLMPELNYMSVTLITDDCGLGDGLATAVFNMPLEEGKTFVDSCEGVYGMWVGLDGEKVYTKGFEDFFK